MSDIIGRMESNSGGAGNIQLGELAFFTSGLERVTVDKFGNVGIGAFDARRETARRRHEGRHL